jgi:hypothetical protein
MGEEAWAERMGTEEVLHRVAYQMESGRDTITLSHWFRPQHESISVHLMGSVSGDALSLIHQALSFLPHISALRSVWLIGSVLTFSAGCT